MNRGQGCVADMLVFVMLTSVACSLLLVSAPRDGVTDAYGMSVARATLQALQHATIDEFGSVVYSPTLLPTRELHHKTFTQLLLEDALLNLGVEVNGRAFAPGVNSEMDERVKELFRSVLERVLGGRFDYKLVARIVPSKPLSEVRVIFETSIESGRQSSQRGWGETAVYSFPLNFGEDAQLVVFELTLTLWQR